MAFLLENFAPLGNQSRRGKAQQEYVYRTADTLATVAGANYFDDVSTKLSIGDKIHVQVVDDLDTPTTVSAEASYLISGNAAGVVTIASDQGSKIYLTTTLVDVSTASSAWVVSPVAGKVTKITSVLYGAITVADATVTGKIGGVAMTNGVLTIANAASAAGDVDTASPTANNTVAANGAIQIETDGGSTDAQRLTVTLEITL